jgi:hypothetical protein
VRRLLDEDDRAYLAEKAVQAALVLVGAGVAGAALGLAVRVFRASSGLW